MTEETKYGVAWFEPDQWEELKSVSADSSKLGATYEAWLSNFNQTIGKMQATGVVIEKVSVDIAELVVWSTVNGLEVDSASRSGFVTHKLLQNAGK